MWGSPCSRSRTDVYDQAPVEEEEIVEQVRAEASVDDVGEPVLASVAPDVYDEAPVQEEEDWEQVLVEASFDDVGERVLDGGRRGRRTREAGRRE